MADIFLSYAREDRPWASRLAAGLIEQGWSLFWDPDIPVGKTFDQVIEHQLDAAGCIVVLWSRHSVSSNWVKAEASEGLRRRILHPVLIEEVRLPLEFRRLQTANLVDWQKGTTHSEYDQLISGIGATLRSSRARSERLQEARAALRRGDNIECLENLDQIVAATEATNPGEDVTELRRMAEAERDKVHRGELDGQRARAEAQRAMAAASRLRAQAADAVSRASAAWLAAEVKMGAAATALDDEVFLRAAQYYGEAIDLYGKAGAEALEAAARQTLERRPKATQQTGGREHVSESDQSGDAREPASPRLDAERLPTDRAPSAEDHSVDADEALSSGQKPFAAAKEAYAGDQHRAAVNRPEQSAVRDQPFAQPVLTREPERHRATGVASRVAAFVGIIAVALGAFGITYWNRSAHRGMPDIGISVPPTPQAPEPSPPPRNTGQEVTTPSQDLADLRKQTADARAQAIKASAEQFVNAVFTSAARYQRDAEDALAGGRFPDAVAAYREALDGFTAASAEAQQVLERKRDATARLRGNVEASRRKAAAAQAEKFAQPQWTDATQLYRRAEAAVARGDHDKAGQLLKEAIAGFENAAKIATAEATRPATPTGRDLKGPSSTAAADAEQGQLRMVDAKHAADQVAASFYAARRYASAQNRERDGKAALKQSDYKAALRLFDQAKSEYYASVQEAKQEAERDDQLAPLRASLDKAHAAAAAQRKRALDAGADNLAADVFNLAQATQVKADALAGSRDLVAAARAYQDAAERYGDATLRAQAARAPR